MTDERSRLSRRGFVTGEQGLTTSRFFRFTPYQLFRAIGRPTGNRQYQLLKAALARLQSTVIATTIRNGPARSLLPGSLW